MQTENIYPNPDSHEHNHLPGPAHDSHNPSVISSDSFSPPTPTMPDVPMSASQLVDTPAMPATAPVSDVPMPVVRVLSVRGVEYGMMTIALLIAATTIGWVILNLINGSSGFDSVVVPTAAMIVCVPVFGLFFLRLKRAELADPKLRLDPSKRRWSQLTQFLSYIALLINFIYFVYAILQKAGGNDGPSIGKAAADLVVVTFIAGGVLAYYWFDEHRKPKA